MKYIIYNEIYENAIPMNPLINHDFARSQCGLFRHIQISSQVDIMHICTIIIHCHPLSSIIIHYHPLSSILPFYPYIYIRIYSLPISCFFIG